jgi:hypothetical protein
MNQTEGIFSTIAQAIARVQIDDQDWEGTSLVEKSLVVGFHPLLNAMIAERARFSLGNAQRMVVGYYRFLRARVGSSDRVPASSNQAELLDYFAVEGIGDLGLRQEDREYLLALKGGGNTQSFEDVCFFAGLTPDEAVVIEGYLLKLQYVTISADGFRHITLAGKRFIEG